MARCKFIVRFSLGMKGRCGHGWWAGHTRGTRKATSTIHESLERWMQEDRLTGQVEAGEAF